MCQSMTLADKTHFCNICVSSSFILPSLQTKRVLAERTSPVLQHYFNWWRKPGYRRRFMKATPRKHYIFYINKKGWPNNERCSICTGNANITNISYSITNISFCSVCIIHSVNIPSTEDGHRGAGCTRHPKIQNTRGDTGKTKMHDMRREVWYLGSIP